MKDGRGRVRLEGRREGGGVGGGIRAIEGTDGRNVAVSLRIFERTFFSAIMRDIYLTVFPFFLSFFLFRWISLSRLWVKKMSLRIDER